MTRQSIFTLLLVVAYASREDKQLSLSVEVEGERGEASEQHHVAEKEDDEVEGGHQGEASEQPHVAENEQKGFWFCGAPKENSSCKRSKCCSGITTSGWRRGYSCKKYKCVEGKCQRWEAGDHEGPCSEDELLNGV
eukprot:gnl/TRDRNA2_/TRDRNA2_85914_c0_seq2.p1 gnl/TRDRNA2_/TRDRNA2_85914_c0~~gnl/TRDRNA2_/TRDRNA2_85914_c0_seq2.p1  ORF type:complete len:136 (+),score=25.80 gnl/TRDRNA2_/TRDRNA2_85914_c0_seq2:74-481(+)